MTWEASNEPVCDETISIGQNTHVPKQAKFRPVKADGGWRLNIPAKLTVSGKRERYFFKTKDEALAEAAKLRETRNTFGERKTAVSGEIGTLTSKQAAILMETATKHFPDKPLETLIFEHGHVGGVEMLRKHYVGLMPKAEALQIWAIRPSSKKKTSKKITHLKIA